MSYADELDIALNHLSLQNGRTGIYYYCGQCAGPAGNNCAKNHRVMIEIFKGTEIARIPRHKRVQCQNCFRTQTMTIGPHKERSTCSFCSY